MASQAAFRLEDAEEECEDLLQDDENWEVVDEAALRNALFVSSQETEKLDPFRIFDDQPDHCP